MVGFDVLNTISTKYPIFNPVLQHGMSSASVLSPSLLCAATKSNPSMSFIGTDDVFVINVQVQNEPVINAGCFMPNPRYPGYLMKSFH